MPNYTFNHLVLSLPTPKRWEHLSKRQERWEIFRNLKEKIKLFDKNNEETFFIDIFNTIIPKPELSGNGWFQWTMENWGTKWEPTVYNFSCNSRTINIDFQSAFCHPHKIYKHLQNLDFEIDYYFASMENLDYGWGGTIYGNEINYHQVEIPEYDELHEELNNFREVIERNIDDSDILNIIVDLSIPNWTDIQFTNEELFDFIINELSHHFNMVLDGYKYWKEKNNIDNFALNKKKILKLKNKMLEWIENDVENESISENEYLKKCNIIKQIDKWSGKELLNTENYFNAFLNIRFNLISYYSNKIEKNLELIYC